MWPPAVEGSLHTAAECVFLSTALELDLADDSFVSGTTCVPWFSCALFDLLLVIRTEILREYAL